MMSFYTAIDPLALLFPTDIYLRIMENLHPHVPMTAHLDEIAKRMSPEQRAYVHTRIRILTEYTEAVSKAVGVPERR
jgi:hypothetical protein